jgi:hypothetical protein
MARSRATTIRLPTALSVALEGQARKEARSRAQQIYWYVRRGLQSDGVDVPEHELIGRTTANGGHVPRGTT